MPPLLILRVHTDLRLGLGHVARALVLQENWAALGGEAVMAISGDGLARRVGQGHHPLEDRPLGFEVMDLGERLHAPLPEALKARAQVVLVDHWESTVEEIQSLRPLKVAVMEDDGDAHEYADLLFQPYLEGTSWPSTPVKTVDGRKVRPYEARSGQCRVLRGAHFIVVNPAALQLRPKREPLQPLSVRKLLVTFGGTDGPGLAQKALDVLRDLVVSGRWEGHCTLLAPRGVQGTPVPGCTVVDRLPNLTRRMQDFDALWCAAGLTLSEALCLGVPAAAWGQNPRQDQIIGDLALANACISLGSGLDVDPRLLAESLAHWLSPEGQETRQEQVRDGMALIDGMGAARVAQELLGLA